MTACVPLRRAVPTDREAILALVDRVLDDGRAAGLKDVFLLTTTAEHYFPRLGFACVGRECVPAGVKTSAEFTGACPASAAVMRKALRG